MNQIKQQEPSGRTSKVFSRVTVRSTRTDWEAREKKIASKAPFKKQPRWGSLEMRPLGRQATEPSPFSCESSDEGGGGGKKTDLRRIFIEKGRGERK